MTDLRTTRRTRWGAAAGLLGATTAFVAIAGAGPAPSLLQLASSSDDVSGNCDEAEHANDPNCAGTANGASTSTSSSSTTLDDSTSTTAGGPSTSTPAAEIRTIDANGAGLVIVAVEGGSLRLVAATPSTGWRVEVEQSAGLEIEVDFRSGSRRVQVNVEIEDGQVRERVRSRDDATDGDRVTTDTDTTDDSSDDDHSGSGHDDSDDDSDDDRSGSGHDDSDDD